MSKPELTPTEELMVEVLAARCGRLEEPLWTFPSRLSRTAESLRKKGYVDHWKSGIVEYTIMVWPSEKTYSEFNEPGYLSPVFKKYRLRKKFRNNGER